MISDEEFDLRERRRVDRLRWDAAMKKLQRTGSVSLSEFFPEPDPPKKPPINLNFGPAILEVAVIWVIAMLWGMKP